MRAPIRFLVALALASEALAAAGDAPLQRSFIWAPSAPAGQQACVVFRKTFELKERPASAALHLFADSRYILWINGTCVQRGPCRFDPKAPEYDTIDAAGFLRPGTNVLAVLVHHYHDGKAADHPQAAFNGRIMRHAPGLAASLEFAQTGGAPQTVRTDASWRASKQNRFGPSPADSWETSWSSLPDRIDARRDAGDWTSALFDDSGWEQAAPADGRQWGPFQQRRIPLLRETEAGPLTVVQWPLPGLSGEPPLQTLLPLDMKAGDRLVVALAQYAQAYSELDLEADAGSEVTLEYGQTFHSSGNSVGGSYNHINRYTAKAGRQSYASGDTFGCKYVALQVVSGRLRLFGMRMVNRLYPFDVIGTFVSDDPLLNGLWSSGVRTIQACSEDAYVDCATRERTEWLADAVMVAYPISRLTMAGPATNDTPYWSDPRLFGNLLRHIGQSAQPDGRVKAHHPSDRWDIHGFIEDYACLWIQALRTWHDNTGDLELVREAWPAVTAQLKWFLERRAALGLVKAREFVYFGNPLAYQVCEGATLNAFLARSLADAAELARLLAKPEQQREYGAACDALRQAINAQLWDEAAGTYHGGIKDGQKTPPTVHAAALCLYYDIGPAERRKGAEAWFAAHIEQEGCMPYQYAFYLEVLARMDTDAADRLALDLIRRRWAAMAGSETKTVWEGFEPGENCHEAGGAPTIYLSRRVLGVQVDGPVADRLLRIEPRLGDLKRAEGTVVTEFGPVPVCWDRTGKDGRLSFSVVIPAGVTAKVSFPRTSADATLTINGKPVHQPVRESPRFLTVELGEGTYRGGL